MEREARIVSIIGDDELINDYEFGLQLHDAEVLEDFRLKSVLALALIEA